MRVPFQLAVVTGLLFTGCGSKSDQAGGTNNASAGTNGSSGGVLSAPADYIGGLNKGQVNAIKTVDTSQITQAIQLFNVDKGRNPKDLDELVIEKYLPKLPPAPYGMKLSYNPNSGTVQVVKQ